MLNLQMVLLAISPYGTEPNTPFDTKPTNGNLVENLTNSVNGLAPIFSTIIPTLFTIMFLIGVIKMGYSIMTKTGHVMKGSTSVMVWVPVVYFMIRVASIFLFTTSKADVTLFVTIMHVLQTIGILISVGIVIISLIFYLMHILLKHPEYGKWSKRLLMSSVLLVLLVNIIPIIMGV